MWWASKRDCSRTWTWGCRFGTGSRKSKRFCHFWKFGFVLTLSFSTSIPEVAQFQRWLAVFRPTPDPERQGFCTERAKIYTAARACYAAKVRAHTKWTPISVYTRICNLYNIPIYIYLYCNTHWPLQWFHKDLCHGSRCQDLSRRISDVQKQRNSTSVHPTDPQHLNYGRMTCAAVWFHVFFILHDIVSGCFWHLVPWGSLLWSSMRGSLALRWCASKSWRQVLVRDLSWWILTGKYSQKKNAIDWDSRKYTYHISLHNMSEWCK